jgi:hypothetical protein
MGENQALNEAETFSPEKEVVRKKLIKIAAMLDKPIKAIDKLADRQENSG